MVLASLFLFVFLACVSLLPTADAASPTRPQIEASLSGAQANDRIAYVLVLQNRGGVVAVNIGMTAALPPGITVAGTGASVWQAGLSEIGADTEAQVAFTLQIADSVPTGTSEFVTVDVSYEGPGSGPYSTSAAHGLTVGPRSYFNPFLLVGVLAGAVFLGAGYVVRDHVQGVKIDQLFLLHDSGMLIRHYSNGNGPQRDSDILSGMLIILQEFVRDSFNDPAGSLEEVRFGDRRFLMVRGQYSIMAALVTGKRLRGLPDRLRKGVADFERAHGTSLAGWNGNLNDFDGSEDAFRDILTPRFARPSEN